MRYAVTYIPDDYTDSVNTTIVEGKNVYQVEDRMEDILIATGMDKELASHIVYQKAYYIRNCDDVDYRLGE